MNKLFYASSITYPSPYANRLQILQTAEALAKKLGDNFVLGANSISQNPLYTQKSVNFFFRRSPILAWKQLIYVKSNNITTIYSREYSILFLMFIYNKLSFGSKLNFVLEVHELHKDMRFAFMLRHSAHIFCLTSLLKKDLESNFKVSCPITVLPDAVKLDEFIVKENRIKLREKFDLPTDKFIATYIGSVSIYKWKGVDTFIESLNHLTNKSAHYVIAGAHDEILSDLRKKHFGKPITFLGWLGRKEVSELLSLSDTLVLPNKSGDETSEKYTSPMKLFEYMTSGKPIISSDLPSIREILDDSSAFFIPPNDPVALANKIDWIYLHNDEAIKRSGKAGEIIKSYTWDNRADKIAAQLSEL